MSTTDRIEKRVVLKAPIDRVWDALADSAKFGSWFGAEVDGPFTPGARVAAKMAPTRVDPEIAAMQEPHAGKVFDFWVEQVEPMKRLSFRWHPYELTAGEDPATAPTTLVTFILSQDAGGTLLVITESGFDALPAEKRAASFASNDEGWAAQITLIAKYLEQQHAAR